MNKEQHANELINLNPQFAECSIKEPSLFDLIYKYYRLHFDAEVSLQYTTRYVRELIKLDSY